AFLALPRAQHTPKRSGLAAARTLCKGSAPMTDESEAYLKKTDKIRQSYEERKAAATREKGLIVVFTGTGKGKSTAAFGMLLRALEHGMQAAVAQYVQGAVAAAATA